MLQLAALRGWEPNEGEGKKGWGRIFHRPFWPLPETEGDQKKKGKEQARKPEDNRNIKTRLFLCVRTFAWEIK